MNPGAVLVAACLGAMAFVAQPVRAGDVPGVNDPLDIALVSPAPDAAPQVPVGVFGVVSDPDVGAGLMEMEIDVSTTPSGLPVGQIGTFGRGASTTSSSWRTIG
jgi:hypothetical protein